MDLLNVAAALCELEDNQFICARKPWNHRAECLFVPIPENCRVPDTVKAQGFEYFLEVHTAKEICDVFGEISVSPDKIADLLIFYAENDAFPDWVYDA